MGIFHNDNQYRGYNIYSMKKYVDKKRIVFNVVVFIITIITLILVIYYVIDTNKRLKVAESFKNQILNYQKEMQEQQERLEREKKEREDKIPKLTEAGKENLKSIYTSENKKAFLTFDDGPSNNTNDILNILKEKNIKATFFVLGTQVEKMSETTNRIFNEGHYIANHGYSHIYSNIYSSKEEVLNEYNRCNQIVATTIGIPEYNSHLFRFPGGSIGGKYSDLKRQAIDLLGQNEILCVDWNALTGDSEKRDPNEEYLMENLQETTKDKNSVVVLMHDTQAKRITVDFLPKVIEYLQQQGYEFQNFYNIIK